MTITEMLWEATQKEMAEQPERRKRFLEAVTATLPPDVNTMPIAEAIRLWVETP